MEVGPIFVLLNHALESLHVALVEMVNYLIIMAYSLEEYLVGYFP